MLATAEKTRVDDAILKVIDLPVLPITSQRVLALMADPDVSIEKIKRLISTDPGLATKILTVANSAFYGGCRNIQNLSQAILRLGLNSVRNIVIATSMKNVYKRFGLAEKLLWEQLIGSALASNVIAKYTKTSDPEDAFIGGLLHDIGKVVLNNEYPDAFAKVMERVYNDGIPYSAAELEVFDFPQRRVGAAVVKKWGFPENLELLLRHFDNQEVISKERYLFNLVIIITMADKMCQKFGMGWRTPGGDAVDFGNLPESLGLDADGMKDLTEKIRETLSQGVDLY
ncbi:MAG: HDOD domain-containing protein [Deltaproteobacteria bacterium]|nr:HDOD domain-containing protein [Deltaproteobacteria bacterium]